MAGKGEKMNNNTEYVVLVDEADREIGIELKKRVHTHDTPLHRAFSLFLFTHGGELLLQQRSGLKTTWPLVWSNSCCGHPMPEESYESAVIRRVRYELGITLSAVFKVSDYRYCFSRDGVMENEVCPIYAGFYDGSVRPDKGEIEDIRWIRWSDWLREIRNYPDRYTPWCVEETRILDSRGIKCQDLVVKLN